MFKIWSLEIEELQSYQPTNFKNDLAPRELKSGPTDSSVAGAARQTFSWDLQLWKLATLKPFYVQTLYLQHWKF